MISAEPSTMRLRRGTTSRTLTCAQNAMSSSSPGGPYVRARRPSWASGHARAIASAAFAESDGSAPRSWTIRPAQYASSSANCPWKPAQTISHVLPTLARRGRDGVEVEQAPEQDLVGPRRRLEDRARPVRRREDHRRGARLAEELARRRADVEALDPDRVPLAAEQRPPRACRGARAPRRPRGSSRRVRSPRRAPA